MKASQLSYSQMVKESISLTELSLSQISEKLREYGINSDKGYLSKLQTNSKPPASDKFNEALAMVLGIDPIELKVAAYREKIPPEVLKRLCTA